MDSVAIDGPGGVGKSTIAKKIAINLNWPYLNSGLLYRAFAFYCMEMKVDINNEQAILKNVDNFIVKLHPQRDKITNLQYFKIFINGKDYTKRLHNQKIDKIVANISKIKEVRKKITSLQKNLISTTNLVIEGRDIGSTVLKDSKNKFYLDASLEERAQRRYLERKKVDKSITFAEIMQGLKERDEMDTKREISPLKISKDSIYIDTTNLTIDEVFFKILKKLK